MPSLERHIARCNSGRGAAGRVPFRIGDAAVGLVTADTAAVLLSLPGFRPALGDNMPAAPDGVMLDAADPSAALATAAAALAQLGRLRLRREKFDVRAGPDGPSLAVLDRGAVPVFGVIGQGVHLNGLVRRPDGGASGGLQIWVGVRSPHKATAPGQLDHLVAGGIPAGHDAWTTLLKEADEEASLPAGLLAGARQVSRIAYVMAPGSAASGGAEGRHGGGLRRDVLHCYDVELPEDFVPHPNDDEVERFELWPARRLLEAVRDTETVKFNVNLVLLDLFLREGLIDRDSAEGRQLRRGLDAPL